MKLTFLGAAKTVTGSQYLVEAGGASLMVDCGLFQGLKQLRLRNWSDGTFDPAALQGLVLTHTHLDHIGRVPRLVKRGFRGPIYCTPPTRELAEILLRDAGHLQEEDAAYLNRKGLTKHKPALPLYTRADAEECLPLFQPVPFGEERSVGKAFSFRFRPAGHLLGAASVELTVREAGREVRVLFSGDVGRFRESLSRDPELAPEADYVVVESTYGNRRHADTPLDEQLEAALARTFARGGILLVPAFAVGRSQQLVLLMDRLVTHSRLRPFPIHLDSPMAIDATRIYANHPHEHRESLDGIGGRSRLHNKWVQLHKSPEESKRLNELKGPGVIISSSGMLAGGRILHHCRVRLPHPENMLLLTGYQAIGTLGRALLDGSREVRIHKGPVKVLAEVRALKGVSGHADAAELVHWFSGMKRRPRRVFVTHGEEDAADALAARLAKARGFETHVPEWDESVTL